MRSLSFLALFLAACGISAARTTPQTGLDDAAAARALLGNATWGRLVRIENSNPRGILSRSPYPRIVYAYVFELSGILWFYTDADGTQSLSLTRGTVARDEVDPGPLFHAVDPGFTGWCWVDEREVPRGPASSRPPNACFVESISALMRRMDLGAEAASPTLLSYYVDTPGGRLGHTVLLFRTTSGLSAIDAESSDVPVSLPVELGGDPRALSAFLRGGPVAAARSLAIVGLRRAAATGQWASLPSKPAPAG